LTLSLASSAFMARRLRCDLVRRFMFWVRPGYVVLRRKSASGGVITMMVTGVILLLLGYFLGISILYTIGGILLVVGLVLWIAGAMGNAVGGRPRYW
jgi:hypothetical protein